MNLTNHEKKVLLVLKKKTPLTEEEIIKKTGLQQAAVSKALSWLEEKGLVKIEEKKEEYYELGVEGKECLKKGLPERRIIEEVKDEPKTVKELVKKLGARIASIGNSWLRKQNLAMIIDGKIMLTPTGKKFVEEETPHEKLLKAISGGKVPEELKQYVDELKKRGDLIKVKTIKTRKITLTDKGKNLSAKELKIQEEVTVITSKMIKTGEWKKKKLRKYDVSAPVPVVYPGRKQMYYEFLDEVREKMIAMGFKEMHGSIVQTEFWNYDVLFQPQTHPARSEKDTYYLKKPSHGEILEKELLKKVKQAHEKGIAGSSGWGYSFDENKAKRLILRSHTTCLSAKQLFKDKSYPLRYFSIGRNFRRDVIDAKHLPEFNQLEGIVADESLTLRDLLGILEAFALEIAEAEEYKFKAGYFPYTEPSVELFAKHPVLGWMELGGAGLFRPEMLEPLGVKVPVIAWGLGIDRLAMFKLGLDDIRDLFTHDLEKLRNARVL